jgi:hypothetical protein
VWVLIIAATKHCNSVVVQAACTLICHDPGDWKMAHRRLRVAMDATVVEAHIAWPREGVNALFWLDI